MKWKAIKEIFHIYTAKSRSIDDYSRGDIPFVSNGLYNNGIIDYVEPFEDDKVFCGNTISVSAFCDAIVQQEEYLPRGNGGSGLIVLEPIDELSIQELLLYASIINSTLKWKYSYGRMVNKKRFEKEYIPIIDSTHLEFPKATAYINNFDTCNKKNIEMVLKRVSITELFKINTGDFHSIKDLTQGKIATVSRIQNNNGVVGLYEMPDGAQVYPPLLITVSTVTGDAFVQLHEFIATDNVVICQPLFNMKITTLFFIALSLNLEKWRWSYGRQCYAKRFSQTSIFLPIKNTYENIDGENIINVIDEGAIETFIAQQWGWEYISKYLSQYGS